MALMMKLNMALTWQKNKMRKLALKKDATRGANDEAKHGVDMVEK